MTTPVRHTAKPRLFTASPRRTACLGAMLLALASRLAGAQAIDEGLQFRDAQGGWRSSAALETDVTFAIEGLIAQVTVRQRYVNTSGDWLEGRYLLPLPDNAAVSALRIQAGARTIEGEVREKAAARQVYEDAAASGRRAALVEQNRPNLFRTAVANVGPGEAVTVEIEYWQGVRFADGAFSLSLPLTLVPRYTPSGDAGDDPQALPAAGAAQSVDRALEPVVSLSVDLDAGVPLQAIDSPTHAIDVRADGPRHRIVLADLAVRPDREFELRWTPQPSAQPRSALFVETRDDASYAYAMLLPPTQALAPLPRELVLVIDTSGSMQGSALAQARAALVEALAHLRPQDRFNLIQFDSTASRLFDNAVPASAGHLEEASRWIDALRANGGTEMAPALALALAGAPPPGYVRQVVFATDAGVGNENALLAQIGRDLGQARLFPVGIGSAPNAWFLRKAAQVGRGSELTIRSIAQVQEQMQALFARLDRPALGDVAVQWPAGAEAHPDPLPDLYHGQPLLALARLPAASGKMTAAGWNGDGHWQATLDLRAARPAHGVARLFARHRIEAIEDAIRQGEAEEALRPAIVALGIEHGLVTRFTSLVAVERDPVRAPDQALVSTRFENAAPDNGSDALALAQGATGARGLLGWALALALLALALGCAGHRDSGEGA